MVAGLALMGGGSLLLALAPGDASYATDLLPGYLALRFGAGLVFPAVSITAMTDVGHDDAGMASGLMRPATRSGRARRRGPVRRRHRGRREPRLGFEDGSLASAVIAAALAVLALVCVPAVRPVDHPGVRPLAVPEPAADHRRAVAERNVEAILDAGERLLERHAQPSIAAVAAEAGVSG